MSYEKLSDLLDALQTTLTTDTAIVAYCLEKYSRYPTYFKGVNPDEPPPEEDYPVIALVRVSKTSKGDAEKFRIHTMDISVGIRNETKTETTAINGAKIVSYSGIQEIEEFREIVEDAIFGAKLALKISFVGTAITDIEFPCFRSDMTLELWYRESTRTTTKN